MATRAPMAPMASTQVTRQSVVEKHNHKLLKWNSTYNDYYRRDWKDETLKYLSDKIKPNAKITSYKWYKYESTKINDIPSLRGHSLSDIGADSMITIGDRRKREKIDIYRISKYFNKFEQLHSNGPSPCCRFHHSAQYIPTLHAILFFGGFDAQCNYNDARLLSLDTMIWYDLEYDQHIDHRAHHSCASRLVKADYENSQSQRFECYIFGGMFCNGGPYVYHNDVFKFTFYDCESKQNDSDKSGNFECDKLVIKGGKTPSQRSQSHSWIKDNVFYVFGGTQATITLNDLWALDLSTNVWTEIEYEGILRAPQTYSIKPKNYRVNAARKPCYFDAEMNELIVIHYGKLSAVQREFIQYGATLTDFKKYLLEKKQQEKDTEKEENTTRRKGAIGLLQEVMKCTIFVFDMNERVWYIKRDKNFNDKDRQNVPSKLIGTTRVLRIGEYLIQIGGGYGRSNVNYVKNLYMLKIPTSVWSKERLIWIGHYKDEISVFNKCAKDVIHLILSFLR